MDEPGRDLVLDPRAPRAQARQLFHARRASSARRRFHRALEPLGAPPLSLDLADREAAQSATPRRVVLACGTGSAMPAAETYDVERVVKLLHDSGATHVRARKHGATVIVESGPDNDPLKHFRLRRDTVHLWC